MFMDWISDCHLSKVEPEEPGVDGEKPPAKPSQRSDIQEKCVKVGSACVHGRAARGLVPVEAEWVLGPGPGLTEV